MAALTDRRAARERLMKLAEQMVDRLIPADETVGLKGGTFRDWEDQADEIERTLCPAFLEERSALEPNAQLSGGGRCPHCGSERVYLIRGRRKVEMRTTHGPAVVEQQSCRCRSCDRTFSPSGS